MNTRSAISLLVSAAAAAAALWIYESQPRRVHGAPATVPIQDGKTIDFSDGSPAVKDSAADKAAMDAAVKEMDAASKDVSFPANPPPKKATPTAVPIQDDKTIDFSGGSPAVKDSAADKAAMDASVKEMDAASKDVSFPANSPPKK